MNGHKDTYMSLEELGTRLPAYLPTFSFPGGYIDEAHRFYSMCPVRDGALIQVSAGPCGSIIEGWLRREDALKLYEMAYSVGGDILELGSYHGLSTSILSTANRNSPKGKSIYTVDLSSSCVATTLHNLRAMELDHKVQAVCSDALVAVRDLAEESREFEFVFVDHSHAYEPVRAVCAELRKIVSAGGFCLFHDFNDPRNRDSKNSDYGVYTAVLDGLSLREFEFYGVFGCAALYRAI
jgi:predicted O-methyltransferase YrrM